MSREIEPTREIRQKSLTRKEEGLPLSFHKNRLAEAEAARIQRQNTDKEKKHDNPEEPQYRNIEDLKRAINSYNDSNAVLENQVAQRTGNYNSSELPVDSLQRITNLFDWTVRGQQIQQAELTRQLQQIERAQAIQQQATALELKSDPSQISQETPQENNISRKRKALGDITNSSTNDPDTRVAKRVKRDNTQIDENSANPSRETKIKAAEHRQYIPDDLIRSEMDLPKIDREKLKEQVEAKFKQEQQEDRKQLEQELAKRLQYQGDMPPTSDATQQSDKKQTDSDSSSDSQNQLQQLEAQLRIAQQNKLPPDEIQDLENRINHLQMTTKGRSDAQRPRV